MNCDHEPLFHAKGDECRNVHLDWLADYTPSAMAEAFKLSADRVIAGCEDDPGHPDKFFYPATFLYRHYLELEFKNIISRGTELSPPASSTTMARGHNLAELWKRAKKVICTGYPNGNPDDLLPIDNAIAEFATIDRDGQNFRYYTDPQGNRNLVNAPRIISLEHLRREMNKIFDLLVGCSLGISSLVDDQREMAGDAASLDHLA